jgi:hypothetical protein
MRISNSGNCACVSSWSLIQPTAAPEYNLPFLGCAAGVVVLRVIWEAAWASAGKPDTKPRQGSRCDGAKDLMPHHEASSLSPPCICKASSRLTCRVPTLLLLRSLHRIPPMTKLKMEAEPRDSRDPQGIRRFELQKFRETTSRRTGRRKRQYWCRHAMRISSVAF